MKSIVSRVIISLLLALANGPWLSDGTIAAQQNIKPPDEQLLGIHNDNGILSMAISPNGAVLVTAGIDNSTCGWDLLKKKKMWTWEKHSSQRTTIAFAPDGKRFLIAGGESLVEVWNATSWRLEASLTGHKKPVYACAVSDDSKVIYLADFSGAFLVWSSADWKATTTFPAPAFVYGAALSSDNQTLFAIGSEEIWAIAIQKGSPRQKAKAHAIVNDDGKISRIGIYAIGVSHKANVLATGGVDGKVIVWDQTKLEPIRTLIAHKNIVQSVAFTSDGKHLVSCDSEEICVWRVETGKLIARVRDKRVKSRPRDRSVKEGPNPGFTSLVISPKDSSIIVSDRLGRVRRFQFQELTEGN